MNLQAESGVLPGLQPAVYTNQFMTGGMQGQLFNSQLLVQPQTSQQPVLIKSQTTSMTPSKPLISSGKPFSTITADCTPLHQVAIAKIIDKPNCQQC